MENLTNLRQAEFYGDNSTYTDVDPLQNLTKLEVLRLPMHSRGVRFNADGLSGLTSLTSLDMECGVESLEPLRNLTNLTNLSVSNGGMVDGAFNSWNLCRALTNLQSLSVRVRPANDLVDLSPLSGLTQLNTPVHSHRPERPCDRPPTWGRYPGSPICPVWNCMSTT